MFVCKIAEEVEIDFFSFDFSRTLDEDTSLKRLLYIKNGYLVSTMSGHSLEVLMDSPFVIIFINENISSYFHYLSMDQGCCYDIRDNKLFKIRKTPDYNHHDLNLCYIELNEKKEV